MVVEREGVPILLPYNGGHAFPSQRVIPGFLRHQTVDVPSAGFRTGGPGHLSVADIFMTFASQPRRLQRQGAAMVLHGLQLRR
jgi:hypothetical protein